jgi:transposase
LEWADRWPERRWAIEGARGLRHLLAQQLLAAGEQVLDVQPKLAARVRLLNTGQFNKNDPNDARSVAIADYDRKIAEGRKHKSALRALKRKISDALYARMIADAQHTTRQTAEGGPGGQTGNDSASSATGSHPEPALRKSHPRTATNPTTTRAYKPRPA